MKKILIIEDNAELRENTAEIIGLSNYEVITAANGKMGVQMALDENPDLIICDIMMPVLDGYGVYHLLSKHKKTAATPFIFLTAKSEKSDFRKGMEMGADDYLTKPFDGIDLLKAIEVRLLKSSVWKDVANGENALTIFLQNVKETGKVQLASGERETFSYAKKVTIFKEGQRPRAVYYIVSGKVKIIKRSNDAKEFITNVLHAGEYFGYAAVIAETNYAEEAQAVEATTLMLIPTADFLHLISSDLDIAQKFIKLITQNIEAKENDLVNLAYNSLRKKVSYKLIQLVDKGTAKEDGLNVLYLSRENMAQLMGIAPESLIRTLGDFKNEKLIDIQPGKVIVVDEKKLRALPY